jgi:hypothetical protein
MWAGWLQKITADSGERKGDGVFTPGEYRCSTSTSRSNMGGVGERLQRQGPATAMAISHFHFHFHKCHVAQVGPNARRNPRGASSLAL